MTTPPEMDLRKMAEGIGSLFGDLAEWDDEVIDTVENDLKKAYSEGRDKGVDDSSEVCESRKLEYKNENETLFSECIWLRDKILSLKEEKGKG